jgi:hypothetical protein
MKYPEEGSGKGAYPLHRTHLNLRYNEMKTQPTSDLYGDFQQEFHSQIFRLNLPYETTAHPSCPAPNPVGGKPCVLC